MSGLEIFYEPSIFLNKELLDLFLTYVYIINILGERWSYLTISE